MEKKIVCIVSLSGTGTQKMPNVGSCVFEMHGSGTRKNSLISLVANVRIDIAS